METKRSIERKRRGLFIPSLVVSAMIAAGCGSARTAEPSTPTPAPPAILALAASVTPVTTPSGGRVAATVPLSGQASALSLGPDTLWIGSEAGVLLRIDTTTNQVIAKLPIPVADLKVSGDMLWVAEDGSGKIVKIDPKTNAVVEEIDTGKSNLGVLAVDGDILRDGASSAGRQKVYRVDTRSMTVTAESEAIGNLWGVTVGAGSAWAADEANGTVLRLDRQTAKIIATIQVGAEPTGIAYGEGSVWTANRDGTVSRVDPASNQEVARIRVGALMMSVAVSNGMVWAAGRGEGCENSAQPSGQLSRIDPKTNTFVGLMHLTCALTVAVGPGAVWAADNWHQAQRDGLLWRIEPAQ